MAGAFAPEPLPVEAGGWRRIFGDVLARRGGQRIVSALSIVALLFGVGLFAYPFATDIYGNLLQGRLRSEFGSPQYVKEYREGKIALGEDLTKLVIPKIRVNVLVVQGTTPAALEAGAGHYVNTPLPGLPGNVGIAGHRTTYGRPFFHLNEMGPGDIVELFTPFDEYIYQVTPSFDGQANPHPVLPTDVSVLAQPRHGSYLTLTTCNPPGSAAQRLVLRLVLIKTIPLSSSGS